MVGIKRILEVVELDTTGIGKAVKRVQDCQVWPREDLRAIRYLYIILAAGLRERRSK